MFNTKLATRIKKINIKVVEKKDTPLIRRVEPMFSFQLTDELAEGLGTKVKQIRSLLKAGDATKITLPFDAIGVHADVVNDDHKFRLVMKGTKAEAIASTEEDNDTPMIDISFYFLYDAESTISLIEALGKWVTVKFKRQQLQLAEDAA